MNEDKREIKEEWIDIINPEKLHYEDFKNSKVMDDKGNIYKVNSVMPVVFGSTMKDGDGIKLFCEDDRELYIYQNGRTNYLKKYCKI